nr:hypothetical protein [Streptacidiphilus jiangxiensis]
MRAVLAEGKPDRLTLKRRQARQEATQVLALQRLFYTVGDAVVHRRRRQGCGALFDTVLRTLVTDQVDCPSAGNARGPGPGSVSPSP